MAGRAVFVSDIHLSPDAPGDVARFAAFVDNQASGAASFHVLGDLFDLWCGPAQLSQPALRPALDALRRLSARGTEVTILHGNRDFLLGSKEAVFLDAAIPGETVVKKVQGSTVLLTHGDLFCTLDRPYQRMKKIVRSGIVRWLAAHLPSRLTYRAATLLRSRTRKSMAGKSDEIMSLQLPEVEGVASALHADIVICGHFHVAWESRIGKKGRLIVLSDWSNGKSSYVEARDGLFELVVRSDRNGSDGEKK